MSKSTFDRFWIPKFKYELVDALVKVYPKDKWKLRKLRKKQLYAIYFEIRK